jgi:hypothetical protein
MATALAAFGPAGMGGAGKTCALKAISFGLDFIKL